jgi:hypothetical protein
MKVLKILIRIILIPIAFIAVFSIVLCWLIDFAMCNEKQKEIYIDYTERFSVSTENFSKEIKEAGD